VGQSNVRIIMVTAQDEEVDRVLGLEIGADDDVCKPFSPFELGPRVEAISRRARIEARHGADSIKLSRLRFQTEISPSPPGRHFFDWFRYD